MWVMHDWSGGGGDGEMEKRGLDKPLLIIITPQRRLKAGFL